MDTLIQADIFFFITSIAVVVLTILVIIILFYVIQILVNFKAISKILRNGAENAEESLEAIAQVIAKNPLFKMLEFLFQKKKKANKKKEKK